MKSKPSVRKRSEGSAAHTNQDVISRRMLLIASEASFSPALVTPVMLNDCAKHASRCAAVLLTPESASAHLSAVIRNYDATMSGQLALIRLRRNLDYALVTRAMKSSRVAARRSEEGRRDNGGPSHTI